MAEQKKYDLEKLRGVPLETVFEAFGCTPDPKDRKNWRTSSRERISVTGETFYNHDKGEGGGGSIDLTIHLSGLHFKEALSTLADIAGERPAIEQYIKDAPNQAERILKEGKQQKTEIPPPNARNLPRVVKYLTEERKIPALVVEKAIGKERLWADNFGNAVFSLRDTQLKGERIGAELRGTIPGKPFHGVRGAQKGAFFTGETTSKTAVFVESAVEALSYEAIDPAALIIGTVGNTKDNLQTLARNLQAKDFQLVAGFNQDKTGDKLAEWLQEVAGPDMERRLPDPAALKYYEQSMGKPGKDWNDMLVAMTHQRTQYRAEPQVENPVAKTNPEVEQAR